MEHGAVHVAEHVVEHAAEHLEHIGGHNNIGLLLLVLWPFLAAFISYLIGRKNKTLRNYFANFATAAEFLFAIIVASVWASNHHPPTFELTGFMGARIYFTMDGLRAVYAVITALMWMMTTIFSREYFAHYRNRNRYYFFMLMTLGGTMGVFLSADLVTTFCFFEMMSFTSYVMVLHDEKPRALVAAKTYMAVAVIGGLAMVFGIFIINNQLGTTEIGKLYDAAHHFHGNKNMLYLAAAFMLVGFGGKAGMYPIHIWLPNAHPVAPAPASALLSGVLTKTGIYGIIIMTALIFAHNADWGTVMLCIGVVGMFTGALLALFSIDLKRTLACSSVSQIGFIIVGIGMQGILGHHNALAVRGTLLHMVNHSLIKLVLFMMAGVVYMNLHELDLNKVRGFGRGKPIFIFAFLMGVMGIIGIPHWNGYVSKTLLHESIVEQIWLFPDYTNASTFFQVVESIFTLTGGLTTAYMIKIFTCVCIEKNRFHQEKLTALNKKYMTPVSGAVLFICALILPILGFSPDTFMIKISKFGQEFMLGEDPAHAVHFFEWANVRGAVASLSIGVIIYILIVRLILMRKDSEGRSVYVNLWPKFIDIENKIYKPLLLTVLPFVGAFVARFIGSFITVVSENGFKLFTQVRNFHRAVIANSTDIGTDLANARAYMDGNKASINVVPARTALEFYGQKVSNALNASFYATRDALGSSGHKMTDALNRSFYATGDALESSGNKMADAVDKSLYDTRDVRNEQKIVFDEQNVYSGFVQRVRSLMDRFYNAIFTWARKEKRDNELLKAVFNSLAYSMLLFLIGAIIIVVFGVLN